jgi:hypothetical protein
MKDTDTDRAIVGGFIARLTLEVHAFIALFAFTLAVLAGHMAAAGFRAAWIFAVAGAPDVNTMLLALAFAVAAAVGLSFFEKSMRRVSGYLFDAALRTPTRRLVVPVFPSVCRRLTGVAVLALVAQVAVHSTPYEAVTTTGNAVVVTAVFVGCAIVGALAARDASPRRQTELAAEAKRIIARA